MNIDLRLGDCIEVLKTLPDNSVDSIVTDPPYGLEFMGKKWDYDVPSVEIWKECLRVLKPGGHLLSFAGSRTYHRMAVRIEDAGFEIRDQIMWVYGSGFPKSHNIGKAIDKIKGNEREVIGTSKGKGYSSIQEKNLEHGNRPYVDGLPYEKADRTLTKGNSEWEGWGTALKPAHEPIVLARKPLSEKSIAENVLKHGTGGLNIDGSRIGNETRTTPIHSDDIKDDTTMFGLHKTIQHHREETTEGRWPANIIFDEEAGKLLDEQSGDRKGFTGGGGPTRFANASGGKKLDDYNYYKDKGGASRFFYCPKTSKKDRNEGLEDFTPKTDRQKGHGLDRICGNCGAKMLNPQDCKCDEPDWITPPKLNSHPTVKPTDLMRYLINLITPPNGTVVDPFMGSGSTGKAAVRCGVNFIGIEKEEEYMNIAKARIEHEKNKPVQQKLL